MIAALLNLAVFAALVLCIIGFGVYGDTKRKAWPIAKPKGAVATPAAPLEFSIYFDAGATVTPRSCLLSQEELNGSLKRNYRTFLDSGPLAT